MIVCWAAKGGSGTTVTACAIAAQAAAHRPTTLVDLAGDVAVTLGIAEPDGPGVAEWMRSATADAAALSALAVRVDDQRTVLCRGDGALPGDQWPRLVAALATLPGCVVVDAGTGEPPAELCNAAEHSLLVIRGCYVAVRRAMRLGTRPSGLVYVREPGRALGPAEVSAALGVPVVARVELDPAVARAVDAGLLTTRLPWSILRQLRAVA